MLTKHSKSRSMTSFSPNEVNPLEDREMFKDWRLNIHFPPVNVSKGEEWHRISMAIPGLRKENIKVEIEDNVLIIKGEKKEETKETNKNYTHQEYNYKSFKRSFSLPENVNTEKIESKYKKGILSIRIPKIQKIKDN